MVVTITPNWNTFPCFQSLKRGFVKTTSLPTIKFQKKGLLTNFFCLALFVDVVQATVKERKRLEKKPSLKSLFMLNLSLKAHSHGNFIGNSEVNALFVMFHTKQNFHHV